MIEGEGSAHGALTVVNAIPTGKGAAIGLEPETHARVELEETDGPVEVDIEAPESERLDGEEDPGLARACVDVVSEAYDRPLSGRVRTRSELPIARGLKSSSVAANAILLALHDALDAPIDVDTVLGLNVDAARRAGVTVTGALDDAAASLLGGLVVTDNREHRLLHREPLNKEPAVLLLVPRQRRYTASTDPLSQAEPLARRSLDLVEAGDWPSALTLNGLGVAAALGEGLDPAYRALGAGALAAGLSGTGPAVGAICLEADTASVRGAWQPYPAGIRQTHATNQGVSR